MSKRQSKVWSPADIKLYDLGKKSTQAKPYVYVASPKGARIETKPHQESTMTKAKRAARQERQQATDENDTFVPVKADPPEIRAALRSTSSHYSPTQSLLERLGPNAPDFSSQASPELAAARIRLSDWIEHCDPEMPFIPNVEIDRWLGQAMAERIRGEELQNRKLTDAQVEGLVADMLRPGAWKPNGDSIRFTPGGQIIDGQGRLIALLLACRRKPETTFVTDLRFNVPPEAFSTIDTGKKRTSADILGMVHVQNGFLMSAIARLWKSYHSGQMRVQRKVTNDEVMHIVLENRDLFLEAVKITNYTRHEVKIPGAVLGFVCALGLRTNRAKTAQFFDQLTTKLHLTETDPAYVLHRAIRNKAKMNQRRGAERIEAAALTIKALNAHFQEDRMEIVRWGPKEAFPRFVGDVKRTLRDDSILLDETASVIDVDQGEAEGAETPVLEAVS